MLNKIKQECQFRTPGNLPCNSTNQPSVFFIFDPVKFTYEVSVLCQNHSDSVIGKFMCEYTDLTAEIKAKEEERRNKTIPSNRGNYEITFNQNLNSYLKELKSKKHEVGNYLCRGIDSDYKICNNKIVKGTDRYIIDCFHNNGSERHYFYFCCPECLNTFRKALGLVIIEKPILNF